MEPAQLAKPVLSYEAVKQIVAERERDGCGATQVRTMTNMRAEEYVGWYGAARVILSDDECVVFADGSRHYGDGSIEKPDHYPKEQ